MIFTSFLIYPKSTICVNCICGYDSNGDGELNEVEYESLVGGRENFPTFQEVDANESGGIDGEEVSVVPGCGA